MDAHELYGLLNPVPIVHSGTIFHQQIPNYFVLHKAELRIPNKPNYVSITCTSSRDYFSLILDLTQDYNVAADPIVLWSLIKGTIRNETITFSSRKHKTEEEKLKKLEHEISNLEQRIVQINNNNNNNNNNNTPQQADSDNIYRELTDKNEELSEIYKNKAAGVLTRLKMTHIQGSEKSIKHLKSLEKQKAESKIISKLIVDGKTINDQNEILDEQRQYYKKTL